MRPCVVEPGEPLWSRPAPQALVPMPCVDALLIMLAGLLSEPARCPTRRPPCPSIPSRLRAG